MERIVMQEASQGIQADDTGGCTSLASSVSADCHRSNAQGRIAPLQCAWASSYPAPYRRRQSDTQQQRKKVCSVEDATFLMSLCKGLNVHTVLVATARGFSSMTREPILYERSECQCTAPSVPTPTCSGQRRTKEPILRARTTASLLLIFSDHCSSFRSCASTQHASNHSAISMQRRVSLNAQLHIRCQLLQRLRLVTPGIVFFQGVYIGVDEQTEASDSVFVV